MPKNVTPNIAYDATKQKQQQNSDLPKILIVEDDPVIASSLARQLTRWNYEATYVQEFDHVMQEFEEAQPDLVLMDIDMPEMDGIETAKRIMEMTDHTVPILFVTALCDRQTVTLCRNLDAAGYIVRPYKPVFVKTEIKRILMGRSEIE